ncbi:PadR family transcriptional regulator [Agromyces sp. Leaf222]|uniref:PadR family transcriptional regulator n=1 Tax=Agromyces sp. Leaf222 TaxID=1735688 RepID=UPI0006F5C4F7|nr:helix-turn-helix transcriptional regulator [Agromyces sp. Leaf222]KQM83534.1 hypothetical protein ASE68_10125 [Agromyces sp. Leaf222]
MAVRDALLALLTTGPAYGFALHGGLTERTGGRRVVNVGQTYATIERLTKQKLLEPAGTTEDGLPLHRLTTAGRIAAEAWFGGADAAGADPWDETVDRVLIAASLPGVDAASVITGEERRWSERRDLAHGRADEVAAASGGDAEGGAHGVTEGGAGAAGAVPGSTAMAGLARLAASADAARAEAALAWLAAAAPLTENGALAFEPSTTRPRRGRRPGSTTAAPAAPALEAADQASADA